MSAGQIDKLSRGRLRKNCGEGIASEYVPYTLGKEIVGLSGEPRLK